jgi:uncharacterized protein (DUF952 family)
MSQQGNVRQAGHPLAKKGHQTYHLAPADVLEAQRHGKLYKPESFDREGFIHCTDSPDELIEVGNRYYREDSRPYLALRIACERVSAPIFYEDDEHRFPHIYGLLELAAVLDVIPVRRERSGEFVGLIGDD